MEKMQALRFVVTFSPDYLLLFFPNTHAHTHIQTFEPTPQARYSSAVSKEGRHRHEAGRGEKARTRRWKVMCVMSNC